MRNRPLRAALGALLVAAAFLAGLSFDHVARAARKPEVYRPLDVFADVLASVENSYVEEVDGKELVYGAIDGLVGKLDPHSVFLRPDQYRSLRDETTGEFDGLGLELTVKDDQLTVVTPVAESPGERAGVRSGDRIVSIDGAATRDLTLAEALRRLKGAAGTKVVLELMRDGFTAPQKLTLVRDRVRLQSVEWRVLDAQRRYAYVRIKVFQERTDRALHKALDDARAAVKGELRGLVLDLRNDPGGLLDQAVKVADVWLTSGIIVTTEGRGRRNVEVEKAHEKGTEPAYPVVVLVNRGTASASEIVAGALQDHQRAVIMGTQTFGKGSVQAIIDLDDGSGLKLTTARYYTPRHRSIQELGITPDVVVAEAAQSPLREPGTAERDLKRHLRNEATGSAAAAGAAAPAPAPEPAQPTGPGPIAPAGPGDDYQLRTAHDYLRSVDGQKAPPRESARPAEGARPGPAGTAPRGP